MTSPTSRLLELQYSSPLPSSPSAPSPSSSAAHPSTLQQQSGFFHTTYSSSSLSPSSTRNPRTSSSSSSFSSSNFCNDNNKTSSKKLVPSSSKSGGGATTTTTTTTTSTTALTSTKNNNNNRNNNNNNNNNSATSSDSGVLSPPSTSQPPASSSTSASVMNGNNYHHLNHQNHHHHHNNNNNNSNNHSNNNPSRSNRNPSSVSLVSLDNSYSSSQLSMVNSPLMDSESMPSRDYIAGKPVSRWEADTDSIDIEYKNLDKPHRQSTYCHQCLSGKKGIAIKVLLFVFVFAVGLIIGYVIRRDIHETNILPAEVRKIFRNLTDLDIRQDYNPAIRDELQGRVTHVSNFDDSLQTLTKDIRLAGVGGTVRFLMYVREWWKTFNFDSVSFKNYSVQLVYPDYVAQDENHVSVRSTHNNSLVFATYTNNSNIHPDITPFNAYSESGNVQGDLVYCNFGRMQDYKWLRESGINISRSIHIIRYGKIHASNKIKLAEEQGALGVILYPDPEQYCNGLDNVTGTWWLQGDQVPSDQVRYWLTGDPSTPDYPAFSGVPREESARGSRPIIPVYPVSYDDATVLLKHLGGMATPSNWHGALNVSYSTGPGYAQPWINYKVELNVSNSYSFRDIHNIIAVINGKYEKDHYVIIGAHIDAWGYGAVDAGTSFAVLMDLARTFSAQVNTGWKPRRTIIFALWDASKYGHVGAYEWVQEYEKQLTSGGVAYINIDSAIRGNHSFYAEANPLLYDVIYKAAMSVSSHEPGQEGKSVYDVWMDRTVSPDRPNQHPRIYSLAGDQDHSPFMYRIGMSSVLGAFTYDMKAYPDLPTYPAHNTLQDTKEYVYAIDPGFKLHSSLVQIYCDIVLQLADSAIIPMNVSHYSLMLNQGLTSVETELSHFVSQSDMDLLKSTIVKFTQAATIFQETLDGKNRSKLREFDVLAINDRLIQLSRAFIYDGAVLHRGQYRNVLIAPHPENLNAEVIFPGLRRALSAPAMSDVDVTELKREFIALVVSIRRARDILLDEWGPNIQTEH